MMIRILIVVCVLISPVVAFSQSQGMTVREDRYWKYQAIGVGDISFFTMKFDGTAELNGKQYNIFKRASLPGEETRSGGLDFNGTLLREEDGKVYVANMSVGMSENDPRDPYADYESEEFLLFDFNLNEGDDMPCVLTNFNSGIRYGNYSELDFYPIPNKIEKAENIEIAGENCKKYSFAKSLNPECPNEEPFLEWPDLIEGVGFEDHGILSLPMFLRLPTGGSCYNIRLWRVYDGDGNIIYPTNLVGVSGPEVSENPLDISCDGDEIIISSDTARLEVVVSGMDGKTLRTYVGNDSLIIDKNEFDKGIYILNITSDNRNAARKVVM